MARPGRKPPVYTPLVAADQDAAELVRDGVRNVTGAAAFLGCSVSTVKKLVRAGELRSFRVNGRRVIPTTELRRFLEERVAAQM